MRYGILVCLVALALALDIAVFVATNDEAFEAFDPSHPSTLLPILMTRARAAWTATGALVQDLVDGFTAPFRERLHRPLPVEPAP